MPEDIDLNLKKYIREYMESLMAFARRDARAFGWVAGIIIRDGDLDKWIEDFWAFIRDEDYKTKQKKIDENKL